MYCIGYCVQPKIQILSHIRAKIGSHWKHIGYTLGLEECALDNIEKDFRTVSEQAFNMLKMWIQKDTKSCYCKLISAMHEEGLSKEVETLKEKIKTSK